jgi:hypothetical protein
MNACLPFRQFLLLVLPLLGAASHFRVANAELIPVPPGAVLPKWSKPVPPELSSGAPSVRSKELELIHSPTLYGAFQVRVGGTAMAIGWGSARIGYVSGGELRWVELASANRARVQVKAKSIRVTLAALDSDRGRWELSQTFSPGAIAGSIQVSTKVGVDQKREVAFLPLLTLFAGAGSFGSHKHQGLLAGLEYLEDEPSSSEADVLGPSSKRQLPDDVKITFPLMAIQEPMPANTNTTTSGSARYVALTWERQTEVSALFDSPDGFFDSGGHAIGLLFPGSDGKNRAEDSLLPRQCMRLEAGHPITLNATILGGTGSTIVPAIEQYVALNPLPPLPEPRTSLQTYASLAAGGWLDSKIREGNLFRHAVWTGFNAGHAGDAAVWMDWLASQEPQADLSKRLSETAQATRAQLSPGELNGSGVGHIRYPVAALIYGRVAENAAQAEQSARNILGSFEPDGSARYHQAPGKPDFAKTHFTNEANGLTATLVVQLLENAVFSGNRELIDAGLERLRGMDKFRQGVPRGAQTWECPLHTPDILASAYLVRAYTLGYELTGERHMLDHAHYWAWTGVPFVYLADPVSQPIGRYSTIAVFGATQWKAPVWLGLPVQWCGLVYADALYRLAHQDPGGPWKRLADGITVSGIQQSWPADDPGMQGLLPDSFVLRDQKRNPPAINPATVQACASHLFGRPAYEFWCARHSGLLVHAPGTITHTKDEVARVSFEAESWWNHQYFVLVNGLKAKPKVVINGQPAQEGPAQYSEREGRLVLELTQRSRVEISWQ